MKNIDGSVILAIIVLIYTIVGILIVIKCSYFNKCVHCNKNTGESYTGGTKYTCYQCRNCGGVYTK